MKVREHPKVVHWPPQAGGVDRGVEIPLAEEQPVISRVFAIRNEFVTFEAQFKGNPFTYDVKTPAP